MRRIEGYIDVNEMLKDNIISLDEKQLNTINYKGSCNTKIKFLFKYNNEEYFYKYKYNSIPYNELVASELLEDFGLPHVEYDLAIFNDCKGVISKNYKDKDFKYIPGEDILNDFKKDNFFVEHYNNLDDIWDALEYRYKNHPNKREIISNIMNKIVKLYIFDIIACQSDRHSLNWEIKENNDTIDLAPIYDNEQILFKSGKNSFISITVEQYFHEMLFKSIEKFQKVSAEKYIEFLKESLWIISAENLKSIFKRIENKTGYPMPDNYKNYYLSGYQNHREEIEKFLNDCNIKEGEMINGRKNR